MEKRQRLDQVVVNIVIAFALTSGLVLYMMDLVGHYLLKDQQLVKNFLFIKLLLFVGLVSTQLYFLLKRHVLRVQKATTLLRESEQRYATLIDNARDGIFIQIDGKFAYLNASAVRIFGAISAEELIGRRIIDRYHPDYRERVLERLRQVNENRMPVSTTDEICLRLDGTPFDVDIQAVPFKHDGQEGGLVFFRDITVRKKAQQELEQNREFLSAILDCIEDGVVTCDKNGKISLCNRAYRRIHGIPEEKLPTTEPGTQLFEVCESDGTTPIPFSSLPLQRVLHGEELTNHEIVVKPHENLPVTLLATGRQLVDHAGHRLGAVVSLHDITTVKSFEEQLRHSQKMDSIGTLAGGVAHDFNNIITVIMGASSLLMMRCQSDPTLVPYLKQILDVCERGARLTHSLLTFSRKQDIKASPSDLNTVVQRVSELLERIIGEDIRVETVLTPEHLPVCIDSSLIEQVLMNLAANSRDAMSQGGTFRLETSQVESSRIPVSFAGRKKGMYAQIMISDSGAGMDKATLSRVFDPFFTTKEPGGGTGLGLSMAYGIIRQHEGGIHISSAPGIGTIVFIHLPIRNAGLPVLPAGQTLPLANGNEAILLVEDDEGVREINRNILSRVGYTVITASNGEEALVIYKDKQDAIRLVVADVIMPGMSGNELKEQLMLVRPDVKVLLASGYSADYLQDKGIVAEAGELLSKPFLPHVLLNRVRGAIDGIF